jgi:threonine aldolase
MNTVDLRSDTVTKPTPAMIDCMMRADVGDDVYGEDPTVNKLEERVAALLGKDAGLFTPSGTMANQIAIHLHTRHGDAILAEEDSHVFLYEAGAAAAQSGVQFDLIPMSENFSDQSIDSYIKPEWLHYASTKLLVVENSHNRGSGRVLDVSTIQRIQKRARHHGLALHCDGARLWNAAAALNTSERMLADGFDTVSVCFSKGLGAPVGSVLVGTKDLMARARKIRKRWGGGMRQAGYLAAGAIFALEQNRTRLQDDHRRIKMLHDGVKELDTSGLSITTWLPEIWTNIIYFKVSNGDFVADALKSEGILVNHLGHGKLRAVTHMHIDDQAIGQTLHAIRRILKTQV